MCSSACGGKLSGQQLQTGFQLTASTTQSPFKINERMHLHTVNQITSGAAAALLPNHKHALTPRTHTLDHIAGKPTSPPRWWRSFPAPPRSSTSKAAPRARAPVALPPLSLTLEPPRGCPKAAGRSRRGARSAAGAAGAVCLPALGALPPVAVASGGAPLPQLDLLLVCHWSAFVGSYVTPLL